MQELLIRILILIGILVAVIFAILAVDFFIRKRNLTKFENYDRELNRRQLEYLEQARTELEVAAEVKVPKRYKVFLYTAFVPLMIFIMISMFCLSWGIQQLIEASKSSAGGVLFRGGGQLEWAIGAGLLGGLTLTAALLYVVSLRKQAFSNFVALNSGWSGYEVDKVRDELLAKLEHKVRSREQSTLTKFSVDTFLNQVMSSYRDGFLKSFYGCMGLAVTLAFFDLRSGVTFYETEMVGAGKYFTISPEQTIPYERITKVELYCYFYNGDAKARYKIFVKNNEFTSLEVNPKTRASLEAVNAAIRRHNQKSLEAGGDGTRRIPSDLICMDHPE